MNLKIKYEEEAKKERRKLVADLRAARISHRQVGEWFGCSQQNATYMLTKGHLTFEQAYIIRKHIDEVEL